MLEKKFTEIAEGNTELLKKLIKSEAIEKKLRQAANIIVINPNETSDNPEIVEVFNSFANKITIKPNNYSLESIKKEIEKEKIQLDKELTLVVLEDSDDSLQIKEGSLSYEKSISIVKYFCDDNNVFFMYFGASYKFPRGKDDYLNENATKIITRITTVNVPSQVYGNMMNALKFMSLLLEK